MARPRRPNRFVRAPEPTEIPGASLLDVGFLLLIFLMVATISQVEQGIPLVLPRPGASVVPAQGVVEVRALGGGRITMDGATITLAELGLRLRQRLEEDPGLVVLVATEAQARYRHLVDVLDELQKAHATKISLRTEGA